ncbi:hypothetical protein VKT23_015404 [Stygiomarasmius scandens]|uniref:DUF6534 domain-containing protein n=1 Tax=Marasmiellus scandens TaxID=2682957 RepID=A0ABR1IXH9_9AGAR
MSSPGIELTFGMLFIASTVNVWLFGYTCGQYGRYFSLQGINGDDPIWMKAMVTVLFTSDFIHSASVIWMVWHYLVVNYLNPLALGVSIWPYAFNPFFTSLNTLVFHSFLTWRIYHLTKKIHFSALLFTAALCSFSLGVAITGQALRIVQFARFSELLPTATAWISVQFSMDVSLATVLTITFHRSRGVIEETNNVLNRLIQGSIQAGVLAAIFAIGNLIAFRVAPNSFVYLVFAVGLGRTFSITTLDTLLSRSTLKDILSKGTKEIRLDSYPLQTANGIRIQTQTHRDYGVGRNPSRDHSSGISVGECKEPSLQDSQTKDLYLVKSHMV